MEKGKVILSPHPIKTSERIDFGGNIIDPRTKQVLVPKESDSIAPPIPTPKVPESLVASPVAKDDLSSKINAKISEIVNKKVEELVAKKVEEALKDL